MKNFLLSMIVLVSASASAESFLPAPRVLLELAKPPAMHFSITFSVIGSCNTIFMEKSFENEKNLTLELSAPQLGRVGCDDSIEVKEYEVIIPDWDDMKKSFTVTTEDSTMRLLSLQIKN